MTFPIRGILKLTGDLLLSGCLPLALVALLHLLPNLAIVFGAEFAIRNGGGDMFIPVAGGFSTGGLAIMGTGALLNGFHMSAVTEITLRLAAKKPLRPGRLMLNALVNTLPVLVVQLLLEALIGVGGLLLIVPGLYVGAAFSVAVPAYVCEGKSIPDAFRRSFMLTDRRRLPIAGLWLLIGILAYAVSAEMLLPEAGAIKTAIREVEAVLDRMVPALGLQMNPTPMPSDPAILTLSFLVREIVFTILVVLNTVIYLGLRFQKNDPSDTRIAEVAEIFE